MRSFQLETVNFLLFPSIKSVVLVSFYPSCIARQIVKDVGSEGVRFLVDEIPPPSSEFISVLKRVKGLSPTRN